MKKIFTTSLLCVFIWGLGTAQNIYIRFNQAPTESGLLIGTQSNTQNEGKPIVFDENDEIPLDAYLMDDPIDGIYTKTFILPAGEYQYQAVFADGTGTQGEKGAWWDGRPFSISEEKPVIFRAKIINGFIKFINDEQQLYFSSYSDGVNSILLPSSSSNGDVEFTVIDPNYKGSVQGLIYPKQNTSFVADVLPIGKGKYTFPGGANGKVKWLFSFNRYTFAVENLTKLVTLLDENAIQIGDNLIAAEELAENLGTYSSKIPLLLGGQTTSVSARIGIDGPAGGEKANNLLKLAPINIEAKMYYEVTQGEGEELTIIKSGTSLLSTEDDVNVPVYQTLWVLQTPVNISNSLENGEYNLKVWYETICYGDIVKSDEYTTIFYIDMGTGAELQNPTEIKIHTTNNIIAVDFYEKTNIKLYSISGQMLDQKSDISSYSRSVQTGVYILSVNEVPYKIIVN